MKLIRHPANPILSPNPANAWEALVTTNPAAWYDEREGVVYLLYRAAGADPEHRITFGLATSTDGVHFERQSHQPVFCPSLDGLDAGCVEDPRVIKMGDWYYVTYAARPYPPGQYWLTQPSTPAFWLDFPPEFPPQLRTNATTTGLALTRDFRTWKRAGLLTSPTGDDRDVMLFPEKINGKFVKIHRPMNWVGPQYGTDYPAMWISTGDDLLSWGESKLLIKASLPWENRKIGGNTPPLRTPAGWLTLYHAVGADGHYRLGALLLDLDDPSQVIGRSRDWLMQPEEWYELEGYYPGVCFPCGKVLIGDTLYIYYGGADKYIGLATCKLQELLEDLTQP